MAQASSSLKSRDMCTFTYATLTLTPEAVHLVTYAKLFYNKVIGYITLAYSY